MYKFAIIIAIETHLQLNIYMKNISKVLDILSRLLNHLAVTYLWDHPRAIAMEKFNEDKALSVILFLANQDEQIDLYALLKTIYYADKSHLHEWGRTVSGDSYAKMKCGPVPSKIYDMLKSVRGDGVWRTNKKLRRYFEFLDNNTIRPLIKPDMNKLSETDIEALQKSFDIRGHKSFPALYREAHYDKSFQESKKSKPNEWLMTEGDLIEGNNILRRHLAEVTENEQFLKTWRYLPPFDKEES